MGEPHFRFLYPGLCQGSVLAMLALAHKSAANLSIRLLASANLIAIFCILFIRPSTRLALRGFRVMFCVYVRDVFLWRKPCYASLAWTPDMLRAKTVSRVAFSTPDAS